MADSKGEVRTFLVNPKYLKVAASRLATTRRAGRMQGGASLAEATRQSEVIQTSGNAVPSSPETLTVRTVPAPVAAAVAAAAAPAQQQTGGALTKVILGGKKRHSRVLLSHKRHKPVAIAAAAPIAGQIKGKPIKTRKITIKLQGLKRRITKARKTARMSKTLPLDHIRKELVNRKLLKANSKAPESMIRQMYSDAQLVANKSL